MRTTIFKIILLLLMAGNLSGCLLAPGLSWQNETLKNNAEVANVDYIELNNINRIQQINQNSLGNPLQDLFDYRPKLYTIGVNDLLYLTLWEHPEITIPAGPSPDIKINGRAVKPDGTVFVPYAKHIKVAGLTLKQASIKITRQLRKYIASPQLDLSIAAFKSKQYGVSGAVKQPGVFAITNQAESLLAALEHAKGFSLDAQKSRITLIRDNKNYFIDFTELSALTQKIKLKDGDHIHVPSIEGLDVSVVGEVRKPGLVSIGNRPLTLAQALSKSGGLNQSSADPEKILVLRPAASREQKHKVYTFNAKNPVTLIFADQFIMTPNDIVLVGTSDITRWNRVISQILPSFNLINTLNDEISN